jgi:hypothetical protein
MSKRDWEHFIFTDQGVGDAFVIGLILGAAIGWVIGLYS